MSAFLEGDEAKGQVYMGGGAFRFFGINVYQVCKKVSMCRVGVWREGNDPALWI